MYTLYPTNADTQKRLSTLLRLGFSIVAQEHDADYGTGVSVVATYCLDSSNHVLMNIKASGSNHSTAGTVNQCLRSHQQCACLTLGSKLAHLIEGTLEPRYTVPIVFKKLWVNVTSAAMSYLEGFEAALRGEPCTMEEFDDSPYLRGYEYGSKCRNNWSMA